MKKQESKAIKKARKSVRKEIFEKISVEIAAIIEKSGYEPKKAGKEIKKTATYLAKKLSAKSPLGAKIVKPAKPEAPKAEATKQSTAKTKAEA